MSSYPQFGNPDYGGFTTDEEIARRRIITDARGSPMIGAKMYMPTIPMVPAASTIPAVSAASAPSYESQQLPQSLHSPPQLSQPQESAMTTRGDDIPPPLSISEAFRQIFYSRPITAFDWIIVFVMILVIISFFEYIRDSFVPQQHSYKGGNFCSLCGGAT